MSGYRPGRLRARPTPQPMPISGSVVLFTAAWFMFMTASAFYQHPNADDPAPLSWLNLPLNIVAALLLVAGLLWPLLRLLGKAHSERKEGNADDPLNNV